MSLPAIETAVILLGLGALIGLCRRVGLHDVTRLIGDALLPLGHDTRPGRER